MKNHHIHFWGIGNTTEFRDDFSGNPRQLYPMAEIKRLLGHKERIIHIIKMDIEGFEWEVCFTFLPFFRY